MASTNRRNFLRIAAAGVASAATTRLHATSEGQGKPNTGASNEYDVIIIGGGFAGVTAARETSSAGLSTLLLEAKGTLGGRTFTSEFDGHMIEFGGTWIHWTQPHVWSEVMRYGLEIVETSGANPDSLYYRLNNKVTKSSVGDAWPDFDAAIMKTCAQANELYPRPYDPFYNVDAWQSLDHLTLEEGISRAGLTARQSMFAGGILGTTCSNTPAVGGFTDILRVFALAGNSSASYLDSLGRYKIKKGTRSLIDAIVADARCEMKLGAAVASIEQKKNLVTIISDNNETYTARHCIVTVPVNVLKNIKFSPGLSPLKLAASKEEHSGKGLKFYAKVKGDLGDIMGLDSGDAPIQILLTYARYKDHTLLVGFGPGKEYLNIFSKSAVEEAISRLIGKTQVETVLSYDWTVDPFALGTWDYHKPMQSTKYWQALQESEGQIHFANSDNASGWRGFIDGAIERGLSVAQKVIKAESDA